MSDLPAQNRESLRDAILAIGVDDFVSMADVQQLIYDGGLAESVTARQELVMNTVRVLLDERLVEIGVIPSPTSPGFKAWLGTVDEVMTRFAERFINHYEDRNEWAYKIWLNLTAEGRRASHA